MPEGSSHASLPVSPALSPLVLIRQIRHLNWPSKLLVVFCGLQTQTD